MSPKRKLAYLALIINTIVWGLAAPIVKPSLSVTTPERFLFYRFLIAAAVSLPILIPLLLKLKLKIKDYLKIFGLELIGTTIILWIIYTSLKLTSAIESSLIYSTSPIFVTLAGILFLKERETRREWRGLGLALIGTLIVVLGPALADGVKFAGSTIGNSLMLLQNLIWAGYLVLAKRIYRRIPKLAVTGLSFWVGTITFAVISWPQGNPLRLFFTEMGNLSVFTAVIYMAVFGSIIGATTYLYGQNLIEVSEATLFTYLEALVAIPASMLLLAEKPSFLTIIGLAVISLGVFIGEKHTRYVLKRRLQ